LEPNPSKDRAMHGVDDPLFWNEPDSSIHIGTFKQMQKYI
jgi:hypothetical protein